MELTNLAEGLYLVPAQNRGVFPCSQSIYVDGERKLLFDAGLGPRMLAAFLKEFQVDILFLSHTHLDNISGAWTLQSFAPLFVPKEGEEGFGNLDLMAQRFFGLDPAGDIWKKVAADTLGMRDCKHSRVYEDRSAFDIGSHKLLAIHTPGHSRDHYCFFEERTGTMFLFDMDLSEVGPWYGDPESDLDRYEASMHLIRSYEPELVVSSHEGVLRTNIPERMERFQQLFQLREESLLELLAVPRTAREIAEGFPFTQHFMPQLRTLMLYWETNMVHKHLERLVERGEANPLGEGRYIKAR